MIEYNIQTGNVIKKISAKSIDEALKKFFSGIEAKQFGVLVSVEYLEGKEEITKLAPVEIALKRLGLYSKYEREIIALRKNKKTSTRDVQNYDE